MRRTVRLTAFRRERLPFCVKDLVELPKDRKVEACRIRSTL